MAAAKFLVGAGLLASRFKSNLSYLHEVRAKVVSSVQTGWSKPNRPRGANQVAWRPVQISTLPVQRTVFDLIFDPKLQRCLLLCAAERERLMGYGAGHTEVAMAASKIKQQPVLFEDERCSLVGDSFCIGSFMVFAAFAAFPWTNSVNIKQLNDRLGLAPGLATDVKPKAPFSVRPMFPGSPSRKFEVSDLNAHLLCRTNHTGSDIRVTTGQMMSAKNYPREAVAATWWDWRNIFHTSWHFQEHINALEARAIYLSLVWKARNLLLANRRNVHLTDSYVSLSILAKGRTSSKLLHPVIAKVCALLLISGSYLALCHVDSSENPTDEGSRKNAPEGKKKR